MITGRDVLLTEKKGHIYIMTINREERRNAISDELRSGWQQNGRGLMKTMTCG